MEVGPGARRAAGFLLALSVSVACTRTQEVPERGPATPIDPSTTGIVLVETTFVGAPPPSGTLNVAGDAACLESHDGPVPANDVRVVSGKLAGAFVWISKGLEDFVFERPTEPVVIDQKGCVYTPRVVGVQTGQPLRFLNSDPTLHNVHTTPEENSAVNVGMAIQGGHRDLFFSTPEVMIPVKCDVHPWMKAWVGVLDHPYFGVTNDEGAVKWASVPEGSYEVRAWHERFGESASPVEVRAGQPVAVRFAFAE